MNEDAIRQVLAELRRIERVKCPKSDTPSTSATAAAIEAATVITHMTVTDLARRIADKLEAALDDK